MLFDMDGPEVLHVARHLGFKDIVSKWDGVTYPGICELDVLNVVLCKFLSAMFDANAEIITTFARLTSAQQKPAPNQIHPNTVMSQYAMLIYLSESWPPGSGTSFWEHLTEGKEHTELTDHEKIRADSNDRSKWKCYFLAEAKQNRVLIYDSRLYHCAEPVGGFGSGPEDGRIVLTCFFNLT